MTKDEIVYVAKPKSKRYVQVFFVESQNSFGSWVGDNLVYMGLSDAKWAANEIARKEGVNARVIRRWRAAR